MGPIARIWQARTAGADDTERYREVFETEVLGHLGGLDGFRGAYLLARHGDHGTDIQTLTLFDSLATVKGFAGDDYGRERVTPAARATLLESDPVVRHFEVLVASALS